MRSRITLFPRSSLLSLPPVAPLVCLFVLGSLLGPVGCAPETPAPKEEAASMPTLEEVQPDIEERLAQFARVELTADLGALSEEDREVLGALVRAARSMDAIFLRQASQGNPALQAHMEGWEGPQAEAAREYFRINFGPWDRLKEREPFVGEAKHPPGAGYYPEEMTKEAFEAHLAAHPEDAEAFRSLTTVIHSQDGGLVAVPYSQEYGEILAPALAQLRQAAATTSHPTLRSFLEQRADAFLSDDYYASDKAWMDLTAPVEVTIGPYETYEDELFGYKAAFTAFVTVALPAESAALDRYKARLPWLERNLPIPEEQKNLDRGTESPMRVVDLVFTGGDTKAGVQTIAFNLPNDERVREEKGSKKVLLRNIMRAKYDRILLPIAERVLSPEDRARLTFEAFFDEVLHHELSHGLGPGKLVLDGRETEVRLELKELYSTLEEAKADVMGIYNILALIDEGEMPAALRDSLEPTYVAGLFRSARFGLDEAHGQGVAAQFNYLLEKGALVVDDEGRFAAVSDRFPSAIRELLAEMLALQAAGDYQGTERFLNTYGTATDALRKAVDRLQDVPVDIRPVYTQAEALAPSVGTP